MATWGWYLRNSREVIVGWGRAGGPGSHLETNNIVPCSYRMDFHFKFKRCGEKLPCFKKRRDFLFSDDTEYLMKSNSFGVK